MIHFICHLDNTLFSDWSKYLSIFPSLLFCLSYVKFQCAVIALHLSNEFLFPCRFFINCSLASIFTFTASVSQRFWCVSCYSCSPMSTTLSLIIPIVCCCRCPISSNFFFFCAGLLWSDQCFLSCDCSWLSFLLVNHHKQLSCSVLDNYLLLLVLVVVLQTTEQRQTILGSPSFHSTFQSTYCNNENAGLCRINILELNIWISIVS